MRSKSIDSRTTIMDTPVMGEGNKYHFIYKMTNLINGMEYIGLHSTETIKDGYCGSGEYLNHAIQKDGIENFKKEIIKFTNTREELAELESTLVTEEYVNSDNTYNLKGGGLFHGIYFTEDTCTKISNARKGWKPSEGTRAKMSESARGRKATEECRLKIGESIKKQYENGTRDKMRLANSLDEDHYKMLGDLMRGKPKSEETRAKMSYAQSHRSAEYQEKLTQSKWKKVLCVETGEVYDSAKEASLKICEEYGLKPNDKAVSFAIRNGMCFPRKKYHWTWHTEVC